MIPAGLHYGGLRVVPPAKQHSVGGAAYRDAMRNLALARTGLKGFGGLGATRRERACKANEVLHSAGSTALDQFGGKSSYAGIAAAGAELLQGILNTTVCAQDTVASTDNPLTPPPNSGDAQLQQALAQQNQQLMMLMAQQNQQRAAASTPPPASDNKQTYLIAGGVAAVVVLALLLRK